jgi:branched-chain amino acid transport system permease protein
MSASKRIGVWLAFTLVATFVLPAIFPSDYDQVVMEIAAVYVIATAGLNVAIGFSGQFLMAQAALMGISAYATAILCLDHGVPFYAAAAIAMVVVMAFGLLTALIALRTRTHYLLLATFGLQLIAVQLIVEIDATGGVNGHLAAGDIPVVGGVVSATTPQYTMLMIVVAGVSLFVADWLRRSYFGLALSAVRQSERLVLSAGLSVGKHKVAAVLISAAYAGIAGVLFAPVLTYLVPDSFGLDLALLLLLIVVVGGMGSVLGVAAAAVLLSVVSQAAQSSTPAWPLIYGLVIMVVLAVAPGGLGGGVRWLWTRATSRVRKGATYERA